MAINNTAKPSTTLSNAPKVSIGETWATITTTWATETRTWLAISQLIGNTDRPETGAPGIWSSVIYPWIELLPWQFPAGTEVAGINNLPKP